MIMEYVLIETKILTSFLKNFKWVLLFFFENHSYKVTETKNKNRKKNHYLVLC